jgi:ATP-dependent exoDNAse (exonuclease V) alpha subunit
MATQVEGFAPTSRAARQLGEAGVESGTLQGFLARTPHPAAPGQKHFYFVDESSLASTNQMREFLARLGLNDRVLLIGDTRQHQGVEAGRPFEQLQEAGMRTAKLDEIVRQKDPALKSAVEMLAKGQVFAALESLQQQGRVKEIPNAPGRTHPHHCQELCRVTRKDIDRLARQRLPPRVERSRARGVEGQWNASRRTTGLSAYSFSAKT